MSRASSFRLACLVLSLFVLPALVAAQTPPGAPVPDGRIAADADQRVYPPLHYPIAPNALPAPLPDAAPAQTANPPFDQGEWGRVAYWAFDGNSFDLYTVGPINGVRIRLTDGAVSEAQPTISPDARRLAFVANNDEDYDLYLMDYTIDGSPGPVTRLLNTGANEYWPTWSPDGSRLAFYSFADGQAELYTIRADGSQLTRLTSDPSFDGYPTWSPDGTQIAFSSYRTGGYRIYVMNADGSNVRRLSNQSGSLYPIWSPDGATIAYSADPDNDGWLDAMMMNADGSRQRLFVDTPPLHDVELRSWAPNGQAIAYTNLAYIFIEGEWYIREAMTFMHNTDPDNPSRQMLSTSFSFDPAWTKVDWLAPETAALSLPGKSGYKFTVDWQGGDRGPAGLWNYDVQMRAGNGAWTDWQMWTQEQSATFEGTGGVTYAFRSRGRDYAGNVEPWPATPDAVTRVESDPPRTTVEPLPTWTRAGEAVTLHWNGYDLGLSGLKSYEAQVRVGAGPWLSLNISPSDTKVTLQPDTVGAAPGARLAFRVRAVDMAGNVEPWAVDPGDTATTLYTSILNGVVVDNAGTPVSGATAEVSPAPLTSVVSGPDGGYAAYFGATPATLTARWAKTGYGALPVAPLSLTQDATQLVVMPPADNVVVNGDFEAADWGAWQPGGSNPPVRAADAGHSGAGAALGSPTPPFTDRHGLMNTPTLTEHNHTLALDGAGNAFVLWRTRPPNVEPWAAFPLYSAVRGADGQWQNTVKLADKAVDFDVALSSNGDLALAMAVNGDRLYLLRQSGLVWGAPQAIPGTQGGHQPILVSGPNGRLDVLFMNQNGLQHLRRAADGAWSPITAVNAASPLWDDPLLLPDGSLHVFWNEAGGARRRRLGADGVWGAIETAPDVNSDTILVAADAAGGIHLVWREGEQYYETQVYYRRWSNGQWGPREPILPAATTYGQYLELLGLEVSANGQPHVLLGWDRKLIYAQRAGAAWSTNTIRTVATHYAAYGTLTLDASGTPHVTYQDQAANGSYNVFYITHTDGQWSTPLLLSQTAKSAYDGKLAIDSFGNRHAIWLAVPAGATNHAEDLNYAGPAATGQAESTSLFQAVTIPAGMASPTCSFLYASVGALSLILEAPGHETVVTPLAGSPGGMRHVALPLDEYAGQTVNIGFVLAAAANTPPMWAKLDEVSLGAAHADVWVTAESTRGAPGKTAQHTIRVGNRGAAAASGVTLTYTLPPELRYVSASRPPASLSPLRWDIGALPPGGAPLVIELTVAARQDAGQTVNSTAALAADNELELLNNNATAATPLGSVIYLPNTLGNN